MSLLQVMAGIKNFNPGFIKKPRKKKPEIVHHHHKQVNESMKKYKKAFKGEEIDRFELMRRLGRKSINETLYKMINEYKVIGFANPPTLGGRGNKRLFKWIGK